MRSVGIFTYSVKPRGSVVHAACLAEALTDLGVQAVLYALAKPGDEFFRALRCPLVLFPAAAAPADPDRLIEQRIAELHAGFRALGQRHDVYHAEDCLTASALVTAQPALRPVVRTVHHVEEFASSYLAACQRRSIEASELVLSVSRRTRRDVSAAFGRDARTVYNGVDLDRFAHVPPLPAEVAERLGLRAGDVLVLSVGGVEERKNTLRALSAVSAAAARDERLRWAVVGGASIWDHSQLERRFDEQWAALPAGVRERIVRLGPVSEATLTALYARSDILLCPSLHEGWGLAALEALAAETAVIASDREPFTEFLDRGVACLVNPESTAEITRALVRLAGDAALRSRLAAGGRLRARVFTWKRTALAHLDAYRSLDSARRTGAATAVVTRRRLEDHA